MRGWVGWVRGPKMQKKCFGVINMEKKNLKCHNYYPFFYFDGSSILVIQIILFCSILFFLSKFSWITKTKMVSNYLRAKLFDIWVSFSKLSWQLEFWVGWWWVVTLTFESSQAGPRVEKGPKCSALILGVNLPGGDHSVDCRLLKLRLGIKGKVCLTFRYSDPFQGLSI